MKFGRLQLVGPAGSYGRHRYWEFRCDCGRKVIARMWNVRTGRTVSCGCWRLDRVSLPRVFLEHGGECRPLLEWSKRTGIAANTIRYRLRVGWTVDQALSVPVRQYPRKRGR